MIHILILSTSLAIQLIAAILVLRLIRITGRRLTWIALASAMALMCVRRAITLGQLIEAESLPPSVSSAEIVALTISILMLVAAATAGPVFQATRRLSEFESRMGRVLDSSLHEIYTFDEESLRFIDVNRGARSNLGYTMQELSKMTPTDLKPEFSDKKFRRMLEPLLSGEEQRVRFSTIHRRKDDSEYPVDVDLQLASDVENPSFVAVIQDTTDKTKAESALAESEAHLRALVENVEDIITELDETGRIVYHSPSIRRILGYEPEERVGADSMELIHPDDREKVSDGLGNLFHGGESPSLVYRLRHKDGSWRTIEGVGTIRKAGGGRQYIVINQRDITEREEAERKLRQSQKLETIGTLAGGIAHDLNNILTPVLGYAEMLEDKLQREQDREYAHEIISASQRAKELIHQILTFTRRSATDFKVVSMHDVVGEAVRLVRASMPATVSLQTNIDEDAGCVRGDATQIHQVILNLCTNAYQAMQPDGGDLDVVVKQTKIEHADGSAPNTPQAGSYVQVTISDSGPGMDGQTIERIFEPFFSTKPMSEGTGLGLSVALGVMAGHDGYLTVDSAPGEGSSFHAWFPRVEQAEAQGDAEAPARPRGGTERVLLVDDEPAVLRFVTEILESLGYQVTSVASPAEVVTLVSNDPGRFDVLITDQTMPEMTGLQLAETVRELGAQMPIILMSGFSEELISNGAGQRGVDAIISKPFQGTDLDAAIRSSLDRRETD